MNLNLSNQLLNKINRLLSEKAVKYNLLVEKKAEITNSIQDLTKRERVLYNASLLLQEASTFSRLKMKQDIEHVVSHALKDVFEDPTMGFVIEYDSSHNKVIANFFLTKQVDDQTIQLDILEECGGGVADVVSLAIRVVLLLYHSRNVAKILLLDEACTSISNFSGEVLNNLGKWLKMVSEKFDIQIILVTQKSELAAFADKSFKVEMGHEGYSKVIEE